MVIDYNSMSDFEINKRVAEAQGLPTTTKTIWNPHTWPEYCTSPSDAWPIIVDSNICVESGYPIGNVWSAYRYEFSPPDDFQRAWVTPNKNPLRAAMIVYLMIKDAEND